MARPSRSVSLVRALLLAAGVATAFPAAHGQAGSTKRNPDQRDTIPTTRVVLVPATEKYELSRITRALNGRQVVAIYTTDGQVAQRLGDRLHASLGGSLIPQVRAGKEAADFAGVLVETIVDNAARQNLQRALVVVLEPDLVRPFIHRAVGARAAEGAGADAATGTFVILVRADNARFLMMFVR